MKQYKKYSQSGEINFYVDDKEGILESVKQRFKDGKIDELDGITIEYDDWWFNLRPSNTEALIRLNVEANSIKKVKEKLKLIESIIKGK